MISASDDNKTRAEGEQRRKQTPAPQDKDKNKNANDYESTVENENKTCSQIVSTKTTLSSEQKCNDVETENENAYLRLLRTNKNFRYFWLSYVVNRIGEWMSYLASISLIQEVTNNRSDNNIMISILLLVKLLPNVFFSPIGGILADSYDRRNVQITLDVASSWVLVVFLWSYHRKSVPICYLANFLLDVLAGLYLPNNNAIVPQLVGNDPSNTEEENDEELKKATTLTGLTWSLMAALGSSLGGVMVAVVGIEGCFVIDSVTYLISAGFLYFGVQGNYNVKSKKKTAQSVGTVVADETSLLLEVQKGSSEETTQEEGEKRQLSATNDGDGKSAGTLAMFVRGLQFAFVQEPLVGAYALLKGTGALTWGAVDVLNVTFSERGSQTNPSLTALKLGLLFASTGVGCIVGSVITDIFSSLSHPKCIVRLCVLGYLAISMGLIQMSWFPNVFWSICLSGIVRSNGAAIVWINSTLLIQKFTPPELLGRINSIDTSLALLGEALSALGGGWLMDHMGVSPEGLAKMLSLVALWLGILWSPLALKAPITPQEADGGDKDEKE